MSKEIIEQKLDSLIDQEITLVKKIKKSAGHITSYAGLTGTLKSYGEGDSKGSISANIVVDVELGKKVKRIEQISLWVDHRDIVGFES